MRKDRVGHAFGRLTILSQSYRDGRSYSVCLCVCGTQKKILTPSLVAGITQSCGCLRKERAAAFQSRKSGDYVGERFNRLVVLSQFMKSVRGKNFTWTECLCDCGKKSFVRLTLLKSGHTNSCGCYAAFQRKKATTSHGMYGTRVYRVWDAIIQRCTNPKNSRYSDYGGRGIEVCDSWFKFENFYADFGHKLIKNSQIDREDNDKGYFEENCRVVDGTANARNTRKSMWWWVDGVRYPSGRAAALALGVCYSTVHARSESPRHPNYHSELKYK